MRKMLKMFLYDIYSKRLLKGAKKKYKVRDERMISNKYCIYFNNLGNFETIQEGISFLLNCVSYINSLGYTLVNSATLYNTASEILERNYRFASFMIVFNRFTPKYYTVYSSINEQFEWYYDEINDRMFNEYNIIYATDIVEFYLIDKSLRHNFYIRKKSLISRYKYKLYMWKHKDYFNKNQFRKLLIPKI